MLYSMRPTVKQKFHSNCNKQKQKKKHDGTTIHISNNFFLSCGGIIMIILFVLFCVFRFCFVRHAILLLCIANGLINNSSQVFNRFDQNE